MTYLVVDETDMSVPLVAHSRDEISEFIKTQEHGLRFGLYKRLGTIAPRAPKRRPETVVDYEPEERKGRADQSQGKSTG